MPLLQTPNLCLLEWLVLQYRARSEGTWTGNSRSPSYGRRDWTNGRQNESRRAKERMKCCREYYRWEGGQHCWSEHDEVCVLVAVPVEMSLSTKTLPVDSVSATHCQVPRGVSWQQAPVPIASDPGPISPALWRPSLLPWQRHAVQ